MDAGAITVRTVVTVLMATWPRRILLGTLLLVPIIAAAVGGFRAAPPERHDVAPGQMVDLGPMTVTPVAFFVSDEVNRSGLEIAGAQAWLGVIVQVENTTTTAISLSSSGPASDAVVPQLPDDVNAWFTWSTANTALRVADASEGGTALPDVPTEVALMWPLLDADAVGDTLRIDMTESVFEHGIVSGEDVWLSIGDVWETTLRRTELPETLVEPKEEL